MSYKELIKDVPNFPKQGILFKDITPIFENTQAFAQLIEDLKEASKDFDFDKLALIESRGFLFGTALSVALQKPFFLIRKKGKLPREVYQEEYDLEYGKDILEIHKSSVKEGESVLIVDDLLATGGTLSASENLIEKAGGAVSGSLCVIELKFLLGEKSLKKPFKALIQY